jgi:putative NADH-flavin reductase
VHSTTSITNHNSPRLVTFSHLFQLITLLSPTTQTQILNMHVLVIGATGNLGLRIIASLLTHKHTVVAYVRSSPKLESLLPHSVFSHITVVQGDAKDSTGITNAILSNNCDAVVNTAGLAGVAPWSKGDLPAIFRTVVDGVREAGLERKEPLRAWFLGGFGVLHYPGSETMLSS